MSRQLLTGCISAGASSGGGGIPASVVDGENLAHWWKFDEGSTTAATDYGLSATAGTVFTMSGVTAETAGGPTAIGSPDHVELDGVSDVIYQATQTSGVRTALGDTINNAGGITVCYWIKALESWNGPGYSVYWTNATNGSWRGGAGAFITYGMHFAWEGETAGAYANHAANYTDAGFGSWEHHAMTFPAGGTVGTLGIYKDGVLKGSRTTTSAYTTAYGSTYPGATYPIIYFGLGAQKKSGTSGYPVNYNAYMAVSDFRIYTSVLSAGDLLNITAGDWT